MSMCYTCEAGGGVGGNEASCRGDSLQCRPGESNHRLQSQHSYSGNHNSAQGNAVCMSVSHN